MTFENLKRIILDANEREWHQHQNGGGWVQNTAQVASSVYVSKNSLVYENARVEDKARIAGNARVYGNARVAGDALIAGDAWVANSALVAGNARVAGNALVTCGARVVGNARIEGSAWVTGDAWIVGDALVTTNTINGGKWNIPPLTISGSKHILFICSPKIVKIGCLEHHLDIWLENYVRIGKDNWYTEEEIEEYGRYLKLIKEMENHPAVCGYNSN